MKQFKLKSLDMRLQVNGIGVITSTPVNEAVYQAVLNINPTLAEYFEEVIEAPVKKKDSANA